MYICSLQSYTALFIRYEHFVFHDFFCISIINYTNIIVYALKWPFYKKLCCLLFDKYDTTILRLRSCQAILETL